MNAHTFKVLEYDRVLERLAGLTATSLGRAAALELAPSPHADIVRNRLQETREAVALLDKDAGIPLGGIRDVRDQVERAAKDFTLTPLELLDVASTLTASRRIKATLGKNAEDRPLLYDIANRLPAIPGLDAKIAEAISESSEVRDSASPELARVRSAKRTTHNRLQEKLNTLISSEKYAPYLQERLITLRDGRYCIPVKAEFKGQLGGIVHDASASGATLFIEPAATIELGNDFKELSIKEEQEVQRILVRLSGLVRVAVDDLRTMLILLANLDLVNARARLAIEMDASEPAIDAKGAVRLRQARHPLLSGDVMPIDIEVGDRFNVLLITGPNTGGKTVALKTVGLLTLMMQSGMQVPCSPDSQLAIFQQVFADIGDEQDIRQSLSTFSAHLKNIVGILRDLGRNGLVLLDEVGAGTDPAEGAALAKAILAEFTRRNARVIATTHYGELKEFAYSTPGVENAAVEFDVETLKPTYRVLLGVPGSSNAMYISGRMGMPEAIIEEARNMLSNRHQDTSELLRQIEESRRRTYDMEREAAVAKREAEGAQKEYEQRVRQVEDIRRTVRNEAQEEARLVLRRTTEQAENIIDELKRMRKGARKGPAARQHLAKLRSEVADEFKANEVKEGVEPPPPGGFNFKKGDRVKVITLGANGELLEDPKNGSVAVQIGAMRATMPVDVLRPIDGPLPGEKPKPAPKTQSSEASQIAMRKAVHISQELMLRAMRVDEAAPLLDKYLDDAYAAGLQEARIIHGRGTGALRKWVWDSLKTHPAVGSYRLGEDGEGGDGATVVRFKE
jgi:DNA mismatch repair protein MutS2